MSTLLATTVYMFQIIVKSGSISQNLATFFTKTIFSKCLEACFLKATIKLKKLIKIFREILHVHFKFADLFKYPPYVAYIQKNSCVLLDVVF